MADTFLLEKLKSYGVGRRKLDDPLFLTDKPPRRLGIFDLDDENLCHEVIKSQCSVPGCTFTADSVLQFENHYNSTHRYCCSQCRRVLPSPHLLDLHIQESHDSFFAVMAAKKASFSCYVEECKEKFMTADDRFKHCTSAHKLPKDFRFEQKPKNQRKKKSNKKSEESMELDGHDTATTANKSVEKSKFFFNNSKQKAFAKYTGRKFTGNSEVGPPADVNMEDIVSDLKESLPE